MARDGTGRDGTLTEWLTPHMTTLSRGSLARNSFTFWATKCFFLVFVLLAMDAAMLAAEAMFKAKWPLAAVGGVEIEAVGLSPHHHPFEAGSAANNDSRLGYCEASHQASTQKNSRVPPPKILLPIHRPSVRRELGDATLTREA